MKKHALNIHALSTLYSVVITDVIDPGFSLALESSHHIEGSTELAVAHRHRGIDRYRDDAEKSCIELSLTVCRPAPYPSPLSPPPPSPHRFVVATKAKKPSDRPPSLSPTRLTCKNLKKNLGKTNTPGEI